MALKIIGFLAVIFLLVLLDLPGLVTVQKKNRKKAILAYAFFLLSGCFLGLLLIMDRAPASPAEVIEKALHLLLGI